MLHLITCTNSSTSESSIRTITASHMSGNWKFRIDVRGVPFIYLCMTFLDIFSVVCLFLSFFFFVHIFDHVTASCKKESLFSSRFSNDLDLMTIGGHNATAKYQVKWIVNWRLTRLMLLVDTSDSNDRSCSVCARGKFHLFSPARARLVIFSPLNANRTNKGKVCLITY